MAISHFKFMFNDKSGWLNISSKYTKISVLLPLRIVSFQYSILWWAYVTERLKRSVFKSCVWRAVPFHLPHHHREVPWSNQGGINSLVHLCICVHNSGGIDGSFGPVAARNSKLETSFIRLFIHSFVHPCIHSFIRLFNHSFVYSLMHSVINLFIHSFIHYFIYLFIHSIIHHPASYLTWIPRIC